MRSLNVVKIGSMALEAIVEGQEGQVMGVTSAGAFLRIGNRILFTTDIPYNSPFNLMIPQFGLLQRLVQPADKINVIDGKIHFIASELYLNLDSAAVWSPDPPVTIITSDQQQVLALDNLFAQFTAIDPQKGYLFLVNRREKEGGDDSRIKEAAAGIVESFQQKNVPGFMHHATTLIGSGGGLTPSGDDFLSGFFLYHIRREQASGKLNGFTYDLCKSVIGLAYEKTTTISANRLLAASRGWSEELFLQLIDHLFDQSTALDGGFVDHVFNFGHSSGIDTCTGIYYAIRSLK